MDAIWIQLDQLVQVVVTIEIGMAIPGNRSRVPSEISGENRRPPPGCSYPKGRYMAKLRVSEIARRYGVPSKTILQLLTARGEFARSASSSVEPPVVRMLEEDLGPLPKAAWDESGGVWSNDGRAGIRPSPRRAPRPVRRPLAPRRPVPTVGHHALDLPMPPTVTYEEIELGLVGSPYSIPGEQRAYIEGTFLPLVDKMHMNAKVAAQRISSAGQQTLGRINRTTEIYQSNRIEGLGPDMATTDRLLRDFALTQRAQSVIAEHAVQRCINSEPKVRDVVGLGAAKLLAEHFCLDETRAMSEADIRQLHELIMVGQHDAGQYKVYLNEIEGSARTPPSPTDTPDHMRSLVAWLNQSTLSPLWRAAVVHAWFTYIHPFRDGNGRIARLLANLVLIREGLPPLIVRHDADRGRYIEALGASDAGGDILPLSKIFRKILLRAVRDLQNPMFAQRLFEAEIERRYAPLYDRWVEAGNEFLRELALRLRLQQMQLEQIGGLGHDEFTRFRSGANLNVWVAKVQVRGRSRDLLLHVARPSSASARHLEKDELFPSIFVSIRNPRGLDGRQYLPVGRELFTYEYTPIPDTGLVQVRARADVARMNTRDAATSAASHLDRVARQLLTS